MGSQKHFFSLEHFREWMVQIYFRKWVSGEGKRLDSENKHIFYTLGYLLLHHAAPGVHESVDKTHQAHLSLDGTNALSVLFVYCWYVMYNCQFDNSFD